MPSPTYSPSARYPIASRACHRASESFPPETATRMRSSYENMRPSWGRGCAPRPPSSASQSRWRGASIALRTCPCTWSTKCAPHHAARWRGSSITAGPRHTKQVGPPAPPEITGRISTSPSAGIDADAVTSSPSWMTSTVCGSTSSRSSTSATVRGPDSSSMRSGLRRCTRTADLEETGTGRSRGAPARTSTLQRRGSGARSRTLLRGSGRASGYTCAVPAPCSESPMRRRTVLLSLTAVGVVLVGGVAWYLGPIAPVATGYAAKTLCSGHFVSGREVDAVQGDLPDNPLVPFLRTSCDDADGTVTSTLLGLWGSTAWYTPGLGCTLADEDPGFAMPVRPVATAGEMSTVRRPARRRSAAVLDEAFAEDHPDDAVKGTRAVVVLHDGQLVAERYADGFAADTPLLGWSMTKSVANAIVGRLVQQDAPRPRATQDLRPDWTDERAQITLDELMHMASGLAFEEVYDPNTDATEHAVPSRGTPAPTPPPSRWSTTRGRTGRTRRAPPTSSATSRRRRRGSRGRTWPASWCSPRSGWTRRCSSPTPPVGAVCSSFMYATARDWARFGQWFLQDGEWDGEQLLPEDWVEYSTTPVPRTSTPRTPTARSGGSTRAPTGNLRMPEVPGRRVLGLGQRGPAGARAALAGHGRGAARPDPRRGRGRLGPRGPGGRADRRPGRLRLSSPRCRCRRSARWGSRCR